MTSEVFQTLSKALPQNPGIYKYFDAEDKLIYVGKAKNIRKRVSSYFTKKYQNYKTAELVKRISRIDFTIVNSEQDAFLLENSLIKQFQPFYNINLKDDKTYPYLVIKNEHFPRVFFTRRKIKDGSQYLGPYTSVNNVRELFEFIKQTIPLRTCKLNLSPKNIASGKFKVCLEYHLGNCKGPCEALQTEEAYDENIKELKYFLKGNLQPILKHYQQEMKERASAMDFEKAAILKSKLQFIEGYQSKSIVTNTAMGDMDICSILKDGDIAFVNYLMVQNGAIIHTHNARVETFLEEAIEEIFPIMLAQLRSLFNSENKEIVVPMAIDYPEADIKITVPKAGDKKKLLELSEKNARYFYQEEKNKQRLALGTDQNSMAVIMQLQKDLQLAQLPTHIECFDNSNFQGSYPVSAMVCFKDGKPSKKDYRHFNVKTVEGIDDFASMREAVYRRYKRLKDEEQSMPQLVIIDGGKGQLNAALQAIEELELQGKFTVVGLAKNMEEIFFSGDKDSLQLPYNGSSLLFIRTIRDAVHRFGITFHRLKRSKGTFKNELESIVGIGENTATQLLKKYRSVKKIKELSIQELTAEIGTAKAKTVFFHFNPKGDSPTPEGEIASISI